MVSSSRSNDYFVNARSEIQSDEDAVDVPSTEASELRYTFRHVSWGLIAKALTWTQFCQIDAASRVVSEYAPIVRIANYEYTMRFKNQLNPTTTVVSAFFPPPADEKLIRQKAEGTITRSVEEYLEGVRQLMASVTNLVIFLPPDLASQVRHLVNRHGNNVLICDHYNTIWGIPNLKGKRDDFYTRQVHLATPGGSRNGVYGHPHAWGAWNAKAFLVLEAMSIDPFLTSHWAWLDVRTGPAAAESFPDLKYMRGAWPRPDAVAALYSAGAGNDTDRAIVTALDHGLREPGTPYWPNDLDTGEYTDAALEDIWSLNANTMIGTKFAMARLSRAQLLLTERDLERGIFVGREEYQMSYLHFEFEPIISVMEVYKRRPFEEPMYPWIYAYVQLSKGQDADWSGMSLDEIKEFEDNVDEDEETETEDDEEEETRKETRFRDQVARLFS